MAKIIFELIKILSTELLIWLLKWLFNKLKKKW